MFKSQSLFNSPTFASPFNSQGPVKVKVKKKLVTFSEILGTNINSHLLSIDMVLNQTKQQQNELEEETQKRYTIDSVLKGPNKGY